MADNPTSACSEFQRSRGGAWPWCATCGWRWDYHPSPVSKTWAKNRGLTSDG